MVERLKRRLGEVPTWFFRGCTYTESVHMSHFVPTMIKLCTSAWRLSTTALPPRLSHTSLEADPGTVADPILDLPAGDKAQLRGCRRWPWKRHQDDSSAAV